MGHLISIFLCTAAALLQLTSGHFLLHYPPTIGFDDDLEGSAPCGSFTVDFSKDNVTQFHVGGDSLALTSIHPQATWLFRATLDQTASGNWTTLLPAVAQTGLGNYCERDVVIPASWAGSKGVIQIVQDAPDGILYQCAAVSFVTGTMPPPSVCQNVTGLSATFTQDAALSSLPATASSTASGAPAGTSSAASSSSSSSVGSPSAMGAVMPSGGVATIVWLGVIASVTLVASLL